MSQLFSFLENNLTPEKRLENVIRMNKVESIDSILPDKLDVNAKLQVIFFFNIYFKCSQIFIFLTTG